MKYMRLIHGVRFPDQEVPKGTILGVEHDDNDGLVFILEGEFENRSVHIEHLEEIDYKELNQELLQKREEVAILMNNADRDKERLRRGNENLERLRNIVKESDKSLRKMAMELSAEREEKAMLLQTIEQEAVARELVVLPHGVAKVLECVWEKVTSRKDGLVIVKHTLMTNWNGLRKLMDDESCVRILLDYCREHPIEYMTALVNGYTIEQTPEAKLENTLFNVIDDSYHELHHFDNESSRRVLAARIADCVTSAFEK